jgi:gamma-glutamylcyclotransferase (GGCT)/AIG2-like uncharacterized protein YtfP
MIEGFELRFGGGVDRVQGYRMYTMISPDSEEHGGIPYVVHTGESSQYVAVEVYALAAYRSDWEPSLALLDGLEGHPDWYHRELVNTVGGYTAWMYVFSEEMHQQYMGAGRCKLVEGRVADYATRNEVRVEPEVQEEAA